MKPKTFQIITSSFLICILLAVFQVSATTYYVATNGDNNNPGTEALPFKTIQKAADMLQPGDTVLIRGGIYREKIQPPRGGVSENERITYKAYPGETPIIKGSEIINSWVEIGGGLWKVDIDDSYFEDPSYLKGFYNPYTTTFGDVLNNWCHYIWIHTGNVYIDNNELKETLDEGILNSTENTWITGHVGYTTSIYANFGNKNPNTSTTEINVRQFIFKPKVKGLAYITIDGLSFSQAATQWVEPGAFQDGMVNILWGKSWIVQNCNFSYARTVGLISGNPGGYTWTIPSTDLTTFGNHIVRNNLFEKCGEAGIAGQWGWNKSLIEGNIIQDINHQNLLSGIELACIKIHHALDVTISKNILRRMTKGSRGDSQGYGIWLDYEAQGCRITNNVISSMQNTTAAIFIETSHGPNLIDNNIIEGNVNKYNSSRITTCHNLYISSGYRMEIDNRSPSYFLPHSLNRIGSSAIDKPSGWRFYNDIYMNKPPTNAYVMQRLPDSRGGSNIYYNEASKVGSTSASGYDEGSISNRLFDPNSYITDFDNGVNISFTVNSIPFDVTAPFITRDFIGVYDLMNQGIENPDGSPIAIDKDLFGFSRNTNDPIPGPFEKLVHGNNSFTITAGPDAKNVPVVNVTGIGLNIQPDTVIDINTNIQLMATVFPRDASNQTVNWSTSNPSVVSVTSWGYLTGIENGTASITSTTADGSKTAILNLTVGTATSITLNSATESNIKIYPNPVAEGKLTIDFAQNVENATIQLFRLDGKILKDFEVVQSTHADLNVSSLKTGAYVVVINSDNQVISRSILINNEMARY